MPRVVTLLPCLSQVSSCGCEYDCGADWEEPGLPPLLYCPAHSLPPRVSVHDFSHSCVAIQARRSGSLPYRPSIVLWYIHFLRSYIVISRLRLVVLVPRVYVHEFFRHCVHDSLLIAFHSPQLWKEPARYFDLAHGGPDRMYLR
jgi:hypothetical protein